LVRLAAVLGTALLAAPFALSSAASATTPTEVDFGPAGIEQSFTVPADVHSIDVTLVGGRGGDAAEGTGTGGRGAQVTATIAVTPGDVIYVEVGGNGTTGTPGYGAGAYGGFFAGTGGGATDLRTVSCLITICVDTPSLASRIAVAGGGGGGGGSADGIPDGNGGDGGATAGAGGTGQFLTGHIPGQGGTGATTSAGGSGGSGAFGPNGGDGTLADGGAGADGFDGGGGGGGGGYYGGGGGGGMRRLAGSGGGGAGSSWVSSTGTSNVAIATSSDATGSATITYTPTPPTTTSTTTAPTTTTGAPTTTTTAAPRSTTAPGAPAGDFGAAGDTSHTTAAGATITVHGDGFAPHTDVDVTLHSTPVDLGTFTTNGAGAFTASVTIPADTAGGDHEVVLTGTAADGQPATVNLALAVQDPVALPRTGSTSAPLSIVAVAMLAAGACIVRRTRLTERA
jgi:hypothetical protein